MSSEQDVDNKIDVDRVTGVVTLSTVLAVNLDGNTLSTAQDAMEHDWDGPEYGDESAQIRVNLKVPLTLFQPHQVKVVIPEEYVNNKAVSSEVTEISVPIDLEGVTRDVTLAETVVTGQNGVLKLIKKLLQATPPADL